MSKLHLRFVGRDAIKVIVIALAAAYSVYSTINFGMANSGSSVDRGLFIAYALLASPQFSSLVVVPAILAITLIDSRYSFRNETMLRHGSRAKATLASIWTLSMSAFFTLAFAAIAAVAVGLALDVLMKLPTDVESTSFLQNDVANPAVLLLSQFWALALCCAGVAALVVLARSLWARYGNEASILSSGLVWAWVMFTTFEVISIPISAPAALDAVGLLSGGFENWLTVVTIVLSVCAGVAYIAIKEARAKFFTFRAVYSPLILSMAAVLAAIPSLEGAWRGGPSDVLDRAFLSEGDLATAIAPFAFLTASATGYWLHYRAVNTGWSTSQAIRYGSWTKYAIKSMGEILRFAFIFVIMCFTILVLAAAIREGSSISRHELFVARHLINWLFLGSASVGIFCAFLWCIDHLFPFAPIRTLSFSVVFITFGSLSPEFGGVALTPFFSPEVRQGGITEGFVYFCIICAAICVVLFAFVAQKTRRVGSVANSNRVA